MSKNKANIENFNFNQFQQEATARLRSGQALTGHNSVMTPLTKCILEAALEGEMDATSSNARMMENLIGGAEKPKRKDIFYSRQ